MIYDLELKSVITAQFCGQSVIDYLADRFTYKPREKWLEMISSKQIKINDKIVDENHIIRDNSTLSFSIPNYYEPDLDSRYQKIFENENLIIVSKPANLPISSNHRFFKQNMTAILRADEKLPEINPIHRIDRETSGLIIYLKKRFDKPKSLRKDPRLIMKEKYYLAIVRGEISDERFTINIPLMDSNVPPIGYKVIAAEKNEGKPASTDFYTLGTAKGFTLLLAKLNSGRKHQIRAHCSLSGFPIVGDKLYSFDGKYYLKKFRDEELTEEDYQELGAKHHLLHSYALNLELPDNKSEHIVSEYFSDDFKEYLKLFGKNVLEKAKEATLPTGGLEVPLDVPYK